MMSYRKICMCLAAAAILLSGVSCNNEWEEEQYENYVSFKAPMSDSKPTRVRVKYRKDETSVYRLPLIVSGSLMNSKDLDVHVGIDSDTLEIFNKEHYYNREDLYYREIKEPNYRIANPVVHIPAGECQGLMDIEFDFNGMDFADKWVLPLIVEDDPSYNYQSHPRKNYNNALLWITPFNDYSGKYGATNISITTDKTDKPIVVNTREAQVVDDKSVFFYAGATSENRKDRYRFKIKATFEPLSEDKGNVKLEAYDQDLVKLEVVGQPTYYITEFMDESKPSLKHRTVTITMEYYYQDPLETPNYTTRYHAKGTMSMQRKINTLIPDEEFAIEWDD